MSHTDQFEISAIATYSKKDFSFPVEGWKPYRLPELATNGFPFSPSFILSSSNGDKSDRQPTPTNVSLPFGFHFWRRPATTNRPVIDLTKGYYDPHTQVYTIPLCAGGDTDGGTISTDHWTYKGDGENPSKE